MPSNLRNQTYENRVKLKLRETLAFFMNKPHRPEIYQGFNQRHHYFEGWYFKHVSADQRFSIALIPGIALSSQDPHAFIQVFVVHHDEKPSLTYHYFRYSIEDFHAEKDRFFVTIGANVFSLDKVVLAINQQGVELKGTFHYVNLTPLKNNLFSPSIMGPFAYLPAMECYHGVVSLTHTIHGTIQYQENTYVLDGGKGYLEKDWGRSFPENYVWIQGNHFSENDVSFFFSYAKIPYLGMKFLGLICHVYIQGTHYRFATYNAAKVKKEMLTKNHAYYELKKGSLRLKIEASIDHVSELASPKDGKMDHVIKEGLSGRVHIELKRGRTILFDGVSTSAGIEIMR